MHGTIRYALAVLWMLGLTHPLLAAPVQAEAIAGRPFGVAQVKVPMLGVTPVDVSQFSLTDSEGRVFYPTFESGGAIRRVIGQLLGGNENTLSPRDVTATFLFTGETPLQLTLHTPAPVSVTVRPQLPVRSNGRGERAEDRLMRNWWRQYYTASRTRADQGDYPPLVETYLSNMLSQRLRLDSPMLLRDNDRSSTTTHEALKTLELLSGAESLHLSVLQDTMLGRSDLGQVADQPVPDDVLWQELPLVAAREQVTIEPMAGIVPPECFYVRFGKFSNYLWLNRLLQDYGGDLANMVTGRGIEQAISKQIERQLAVRYNELSELLGDQVIADMAMIGRDTFMANGAAFGLLFEAKNEFLLQNSLNQERVAVLNREKENGCIQETVEIAGRKVFFMSTPDNRVRSFFAAHKNYRLVTSSRKMVERFYEVIDGQPSLGQTPEFLAARAAMPVDREDTIFIYLSSAFFRGLVSPQYQIELERRMKAKADIELLQLARLAAQAEHWPSETIEDLVAGGFLPAGFGRRPDGGGPLVAGDSILDSRRGARGSFLPIPDVELTGVTRDEAEKYFRRAAFYRDNWQQMDPLMVGIRRYALDKDGRERLVIDANVAPFGEQKYGWITSLLGPPTHEQISAVPGDIIAVQASVRGGLLSPSVPPHHLFLGIQDVAPAFNPGSSGGLLKTLRILQTTPGYLGGWPKPGFLDMLPLGLAGTPDYAGFSQLPLGLWRRQFDDFSVLSFDKRVLAHATEFLDPLPAENPAQIRIHVGDLSASELSGWINAMLYQRAYDASHGNTQLLHTLISQLHVSGDKALTTAENLIGAKLVCPLGGQYEPIAYDGGAVAWRSTAWNADPTGAPPATTYQAPLLDWFRGVNAELLKENDRLIVHAELDMQRKASDPKPTLPFFNLFGGGQAKPDEPVEKPAANPATDTKGPREF